MLLKNYRKIESIFGGKISNRFSSQNEKGTFIETKEDLRSIHEEGRVVFNTDLKQTRTMTELHDKVEFHQ